MNEDYELQLFSNTEKVYIYIHICIHTYVYKYKDTYIVYYIVGI